MFGVPAKKNQTELGARSPVYMCRLNAAQQRQGLTFLFLTFLFIKLLPQQRLLPLLLPTLVLTHQHAKNTQLFLQSIKGSLVVGRSKRWLLFTGEAGPDRNSFSSHPSAAAATAHHPSVLKERGCLCTSNA